MFSKEEHKALLDSLQAEGADIMGISLILMDNYDTIEPTAAAFDPELETAMLALTAENQMLRQRNTELFLRLGKEQEPEPEPETEQEEEKPVTYEDIGL